jgi:hypothetical protein
MLVDETYRRCVGFITRDLATEGEKRKRRTPVATVFFLSMPDDLSEPQTSSRATYAITVKHAVTRNKKTASIPIRVNHESGGYKDIDTRAGDWITNETTDVAVRLMTASDFKNADVESLQ